VHYRMSRKTKTLIVLSSVACILVALGARAVIRARSSSAQNAIIRNLELIDAAKQKWALEQAQVTNSLTVGTNNTLRTP